MQEFSTKLANDFFSSLMPGQVGLSLFQEVPDIMFWVKDIQGKFIFVNGAFANVCTDGPVEEIIGKTDFDIFSLELAAIFQGDDMSVTVSGKPISSKREVVASAGGEIGWRATSKVPLYNKDNKIVGSSGISRPLGHAEGCPVPSQHREISAIVGAVYKCLDRDIRVTEIAEAVDVSVSTLERSFKDYMGITPKKFITMAKISTACELLLSTSLSVKEVSVKVGFPDNASFTRSFKGVMERSPSSYRELYKAT